MSTPQRDLFGDLAVSKGLLTWAQVRDVLKRQVKYKEMGIPIRIGEVAVEMRLLTQAQSNEVLADQRERRKHLVPEKNSKNVFDADSIQDDEPVNLGRYTLEKRLGGVMGMVYRGIDTQSGETVCVKVLPKTLAQDPAFVERFKREVRATSSLCHPNIVRVYDAGVEQGAFFLAIEYIDGETLNQCVHREGRIPEREALRIVREVAKGLGHAHARQVLHRDVKPENVMLSKSGEVKVADFGLAKILDDQQQITADGIAVGTPHYISPEQARALKDIDHRSDLYSLGATFFHIISGRLPFDGDNGAEVMKRHVFEATPDVRTVAPDVTPATAAVLLKLLAKSPSQRFQSADELIKEIDSILTPPGTEPVKTDAGPVTPEKPIVPRPPPSLMPRRRFGP